MRSTCKFALIGLCGLAATVNAKVATIDVAYITKESSLIVVAEVTSVKKFAGVEVASIKPSRFVKGMAQRPIAFIAESTWTCDISNAKAGERVLLYLSPFEHGKWGSMKGQNLEAVANAVESKGAELYYTEHSGRGRIPLKRMGSDWIAPVEKLPYADELTLQVNLSVPKSMKVQSSKENGRYLTLKQLVDLA